MPAKPLDIICFATFFKGGDFMRECKAQGCNVILVTKEKMLHEDWPRDVLDEVFALPNDAPVELFLDLASHIAKTAKPDRIVALVDGKVIAVAQYEKTIQQAFAEVANVLSDQAYLAEQYGAQERLAASQNERLKLAEARYNAGLIGFLDVLDAQREQYSAQQALIDVKRARLAAAAQAYKALGGN